MKRILMTALSLLLALSACTPYLYGVPQDRWDRMSETERVEAMRVYERDQQARRIAAEERARRQALEEQARRQAEEERARQEAYERQREQARQAALERERQERIERIHRGDGAYGELIRIRLQGGVVKLGERRYRYEPLTFTIAEGESRRIVVTDHQGRSADLKVSYAGGTLFLEGTRFGYDRSWGQGRLYAGAAVSGTPELRDVDLFVEVRDRSSRHERDAHRLVLGREVEPPPLRVYDQPKPPPPVIREKEPPRPQPPVRTVVPPRPPVTSREPEPPKSVPVRPPGPPAIDRPPRSVEVVLLSGDLKERGQRQRLERVSLRMTDGEERELSVKAGADNRIISLRYRNGELTIDGTPGKGHDAVRLRYEKEWQGGKVYRVNLKGKVQVDNLEIKVRAAGE